MARSEAIGGAHLEGGGLNIDAGALEVVELVIEQLAAQRVHFDIAVAFVVAARREAVAEPLAEAGWMCVEVLPDDDPVDVWLTVARAREEAGVRG